MRIPELLGEGGRYQIENEIGRGGMGAVYRARDRNTGQYVAIKVMLDSSNPEILALFDKEWRILAELQHTNIVSINDRGEFKDGTLRFPYFVMPFLRGKALHDWISEKGSSRSVADIINIIAAAAAGLFAAHNRGVIHRDVKPSNIFVLDSGSVVVIDFGIVHLGDSQTMTTLKGTTPYMAPELINPQKHERPSPQSDIFALGVVCYEILTGLQPFARSNVRDTFRAILDEIPVPAYELNRNVSLVLGQVVQKAMAKDKNHRYKTVTEFAEKLQRAVRNELLPEFDRGAIEDRLRIVRQALSKGQPTSADELLRSMEEEGYVDPSITAHREKIQQALQQNWVRIQLESVRLYREAKEYATALEKVNEVLRVLPDQPDALSEKELIDQERLSKTLNEARRHMEKHSFSEARIAIAEAREIHPRDTQTSELLSELARMEENDRILGEQKEALYQEAQKAYREGHSSSALLKLERLIRLSRDSGASSTSERDAIYLRFYEEVAHEHSRVQSAFEDAKGYLGAGKLSQVITICDQMLATNPGHPIFQALKLEAENKEREMRLEFVQSVCGRLADVPDLERRAALLQEAVTRYPSESQLTELLRNAKGRRDLVNSVIAKARKAEECGEFQDALERWNIVMQFHPSQPGLKAEMLRIEKRLEDVTRSARKSSFTEEIWRFLSTGDYGRAISLCSVALGEFPGDAEVLALHSEAQDQASRTGEVTARLAESRELQHQGKPDAALQALRHAHALDRNNQQARQFLGIAILDKAQTLVHSDWVSADQLLQEAKTLIPNDPAVGTVSALICDRKQHDSVEAALTKANRGAQQGNLRGAVQDVEDCLRLYPNERRLVEEKARLMKALTENSQAAEPAGVAGPQPSPEPAPAAHHPPVNFPPHSTAPETVLELPAPSWTAEKGVQGIQPSSAPNVERPAVPSLSQTKPSGVPADWALRGVSSLLRTNTKFLLGAAAMVLLLSILGAYRLSSRQPQIPRPTSTRVHIRTTPGAEISMDGKPSGDSAAILDLAPGSLHTLTAALHGYESKSLSFRVTKDLHDINLELQSLPLSLRVITDPTQGEIWLDGNKAGDLNEGELVIPDVKLGLHTVQVKGAKESSASFQFQPGRLASLGEVPHAPQPVILFVGTLDGKAQAECNCPGAKLTIGDREDTLKAGGITLDIPEGDTPLFLSTNRQKRLTVAAGRSPAATLAVLWSASREPRPEPVSPDVTLDRAQELINKGSYAAAQSLVDRTLRLAPDNSRALELKARLERIKKIDPAALP